MRLGSRRLIGSTLMDPREISYVTGLPLYIFTQKQMREALGIPHRQVQKLVRFNRDAVMAWAKRWVQDAQDQGIDVKAAPASQGRSLLPPLTSLPACPLHPPPPAYWPTGPPARSRCCAR